MINGERKGKPCHCNILDFTDLVLLTLILPLHQCHLLFYIRHILSSDYVSKSGLNNTALSNQPIISLCIGSIELSGLLFLMTNTDYCYLVVWKAISLSCKHRMYKLVGRQLVSLAQFQVQHLD